jgi:aspartyl-tRNA(Asn)/glutamyl-tRNA(Gln) amidotransferase subunit A
LIELRAAIAWKKQSAVETVRAYLAAIAARDGEVHAYLEIFGERALDRAAAVDAGTITGPLAGVPLAVKDNICTDFGHTTCSSKMLANFKSPYSATAITRLEAAGAIILGKTNLDEYAMGSSTENSAMGPTRNPHDASRVPGGSSGGSAAAVAAKMCAGALGSDTGGSIRQPAAYCGVVGVKPTYGRVSRHGLVAYGSSLDQIGPITHTVADAALLLQIIAGHDPLDSTCAMLPVPDYATSVHEPVKGLRIGLAKQYLSDANDPAMNAAIGRAIEVYRDGGATIVEVDLPHTEYGIPTYYIVAVAEASSNLARYDGIHYGHRAADADDLADLYARSRAEGFGDEVKRRIMLGNYVLSSGYYDAYYSKALKVRRLIKNDFDRAFESCDAILCPPTTGPAFKFGDSGDDPLQMYLADIYTVTANLAGIPGIVLPGGVVEVDGKRLPLGVQLLGPVYQEEKLLRIARMFERSGQ